MDSILFQPVPDLSLLASAHRHARALSFAARVHDDAAWTISCARLKRALLRANTTLGASKSHVLDITRAAEIYALTIKTRTLRETAPTILAGPSSERVLRWSNAKTSLGNAGAHADLFEVDASDLELALSTLRDLFLLRVSFSRSGLVDASFDDAVLDACSFIASLANSSSWNSAQLNACELVGCDLSDSILNYAHFTDCDLRGADLGTLRRGDAELLERAVFVRCDLRGSQWVGRRLRNVVLSECKLYGLQGQPVLESVTIVKPDLSASGDGSRIGTADEVRALWANGAILCSERPATEDDRDLLQGCAIPFEIEPEGTKPSVLRGRSSTLPDLLQ